MPAIRGCIQHVSCDRKIINPLQAPAPLLLLLSFIVLHLLFIFLGLLCSPLLGLFSLLLHIRTLTRDTPRQTTRPRIDTGSLLLSRTNNHPKFFHIILLLLHRLLIILTTLTRF